MLTAVSHQPPKKKKKYEKWSDVIITTQYIVFVSKWRKTKSDYLLVPLHAERRRWREKSIWISTSSFRRYRNNHHRLRSKFTNCCQSMAMASTLFSAFFHFQWLKSNHAFCLTTTIIMIGLPDSVRARARAFFPIFMEEENSLYKYRKKVLNLKNMLSSSCCVTHRNAHKWS